MAWSTANNPCLKTGQASVRQSYLKAWCGLELPWAVAENYRGCQQNMACLVYECSLFPGYLKTESCLVHQAAKIRMWLILGTKPPGKSGVEVHIFLKCLNGLTTCWGQAGYRNITCCAACSDLNGSRKWWMYSWLLHIPGKYSKSVTSFLNYGCIGCCATSSDLRRQSWSTNWWVWSYVLSVLYPEIIGSITTLILFCDWFCRWRLPFLPEDLVWF